MIQETPVSGEERVMVRHRASKIQASNVDFNVAMNEVLSKLCDYYKCKVLYRESIEFVDGEMAST